MNTKHALFLLLFLSVITLFLSYCTNNPKSKVSEEQELAEVHCSSCHLFPSPQLLDSITWVDHVLPAMAPKLGIGVWNKKQYFSQQNAGKESISFKDWNKIVAYYKTSSPKKLPEPTYPVQSVSDWSIFQLELPSLRNLQAKPTTTLVRVNSAQGKIYSGDASTNKLFEWNTHLLPTEIAKVPSAPVNLFFTKEGEPVVTCIGTLTGMNLNINNGQIISFKSGFSNAFSVIAGNLPRPVQALPIDMDNNGTIDWVVAGFGHDQGGLILLRQNEVGDYEKNIISDLPGAEQIIVDDFNNDGYQDMMVLFAQAREGIWLFTNNKKGGFTTQILLEFPPVYGSTSFQVADINKDGKPDIIYTCGDNADFSHILKPYHGLYIFLNQGNFKFKQSYFYPINGCTKAIAADFDGDGDLDIATIAFFADFTKVPSESFLFFEQASPMKFIPHSLPISRLGRWISMDAGDINQDGKPDIVLGNFLGQFGNNPDHELSKDSSSYPVIVLKNISAK